MSGRLFVGTSGFAYKEWKPDFYPADLKNTQMLAYYAERLPSVEMNNTFYRAPTEKLLKTWMGQTPGSFCFTLKAPQRITHFSRLKDVDEPLEYFLRTARALGPRLGCILFQLPPTLKHDEALLMSFLAALPGEPYRFAMEFRHESWNSEEVRAALRSNNVAWCVADTDEADAPVHLTAGSFTYFRLRKLDYDEERLASFAKEARAFMAGGGDVYTYFKHEDDPSGARFALRFKELVEDG